MRALRGRQAHQRQCAERFAGARFTDHGERLAAVDVEAETLDRIGSAEADRQILDFEQAAACGTGGTGPVLRGRSRSCPFLRKARVEGVVEAVADQVQRQHGEDDGKAGQ